MHKLKDIKDPGFKISQNYFGEVEDSVFQKLNVGKIKNVVDEHGFEMPEDYLTNIEEKVLNAIDENSHEVSIISIFRKRNLLYLSGVAAAVLIMLSIFIKNDSGNFENLDVDLVENYIIDLDLSSYEIAALLSDEELLLVNDEIMDEAFGDDSLESYLIENVKLEDIIEQ